MEENRDELAATSACPSFNSYSSQRFAEIVDKVVRGDSHEFREEHGLQVDREIDGEDDDDSNFEFALVGRDSDDSADEIFVDGRIQPIFPIFNRDLSLKDPEDEDRRERIETSSSGDAAVECIRNPMKSLFIVEPEEREERESPSCSSSEVEDLDNIPSGTYCVWRPKIVQSLPSMSKKSKSTGSTSKSWRLRDLLHRSNSDGKDSYVFLTPKKKKEEKANDQQKKNEVKKSDKTRPAEINVKVAAGKSKAKVSAHEAFYVRNKAMKEGDKRKSYLPYRPELVGFFANVNGLGKSFPHY